MKKSNLKTSEQSCTRHYFLPVDGTMFGSPDSPIIGSKEEGGYPIRASQGKSQERENMVLRQLGLSLVLYRGGVARLEENRNG